MLGSARAFVVTTVAGIAIAGCGGNDPALTPTGSVTSTPRSATSSPATATPSPAGATATPSSAPAVTATPTSAPAVTPTPTTAPGGTSMTPTPTPVPTATPSAAPLITITTDNPFSSTTLTFPMPGSAGSCPASDYTQTITATENGYSGNFTAVSANATEVTVAPASSTGMFTATDTNSSGGSSTTITIKDANNNAVQVPVGFNEVCL